MSTPTVNKVLSVEEQRELAARLFPEASRKILDPIYCYTDIFKVLKQLDIDVLARIENVDIPSRWAYGWALEGNNREALLDRVTEPEWAYYWGLHIGNQDVMIDRITESEWAFYWGLYIGDRDAMIDRVTESKWAYYWGLGIGDFDVMVDRVTKTQRAHFWMLNIGGHATTS